MDSVHVVFSTQRSPIPGTHVKLDVVGWPLCPGQEDAWGWLVSQPSQSGELQPQEETLF